MLIIMENDEEIFRAWLRKYVKEDKKITGVEISKKLKVPPPTVTAWHSGRKNYKGVKYFPQIPFDVREKIVEITGVSSEIIMKEGREILFPKDKTTTLEQPEACPTCQKNKDNIFQLNGPLEAEHLGIIRRFKNKYLACTLNELLVELEALDDGELACVVSNVKKKIEALKATKKRTANGDE